MIKLGIEDDDRIGMSLKQLARNVEAINGRVEANIEDDNVRLGLFVTWSHVFRRVYLSDYVDPMCGEGCRDADDNQGMIVRNKDPRGGRFGLLL